MTPISEDLRSEAFVMLRAGMSIVAIDRLFNVQSSTNARRIQWFEAIKTVRDQ